MATTTEAADQKKRTLDALERRFAQAEAQLLQQQHKGKNKRPLESNKKPKLTTNITTSSVHPPPIPNNSASPLSSTNPPPKKDSEPDDPTYSLLSHPVHQNLASTSSEISNRKGSIADKILHELLQNGDSAQKYMQGSRSKKFDNWLLLDNLVHGQATYNAAARMQALKSHSKRSKKHMSMKQHKMVGSLTLPQDLQRYDIYKPMHEIWRGYIMQVAKNVGKNQLAQCLLSADLHGAIMLVVQSKVTSFTGVSGIMIRETAGTFAILTLDNKLRVVPKKASVFMLQVDCWKITLIGDKLISRNIYS